MTVEELLGTLQQSVTDEWRKHLQTGKYSKHMALDEFYKEMPEKIDALIEAYQAEHDIVKSYKSVLNADDKDALEYLEELKNVVKEGRTLFEGDTELESLTDDILSQIDSTIYKMKHLKESKQGGLKSLAEFIKENLN